MQCDLCRISNHHDAGRAIGEMIVCRDCFNQLQGRGTSCSRNADRAGDEGEE